MRIEKAGALSRTWDIFISDSSSSTGAGKTGLVYNTSGLTAYYHRNNASSATAISLADMTLGTFTSGGFKEIDATHKPGWYQFCPPNAAITTGGATESSFTLQGATDMAELPILCRLTGPDPDDAVRNGLTALPNVASGSANSLARSSDGSAITVASGALTVGTNNDKANYRLSALGAGDIWEAVAASHVASGTTGEMLSQIRTGAVPPNGYPSNFDLLTIDSGNVVAVLADADHGGAAATFTFEHMAGQAVGSNHCVSFLADPSSSTSAINLTGGIAVAAIQITGDPSVGVGYGINIDARIPINITAGGVGGSPAVLVTGTASQPAVEFRAGTNGSGLKLTGNGTGPDLLLTNSLSPTLAAVLLGGGDIDGYSLEEFGKLCLAALAGKLSGAATTTAVIKAADDSKTRITATVDSDGNRTAVTLDATG